MSPQSAQTYVILII